MSHTGVNEKVAAKLAAGCQKVTALKQIRVHQTATILEKKASD